MRTAILTTACLASILSGGSALAGACTGEIDQLTKTMAMKDAGSGPTTGATGSTSAQSQQSQAQHPPAAIMTREAESKATSPEDVRRQTEGRPTTSQQAASNVPAGTPDQANASAALARAKELDAAGREAECMEAVKTAKTLAGS
ncbi:hypothetical protein [Bosea thiooxidans]